MADAFIHFYDRCARGEEQEKVAILTALEIDAHAPQLVEFKREGKKRRPEEVFSTIIETYYFARCTPDQFQRARSCGEISNRHVEFSPQAWRAQVQPFIDAANRSLSDMRARIRAGEVADQYNAGQLLSLLSGPFAGFKAPYVRAVDCEDDPFPMIEVLVDLFGKRHAVRIDPLSVRAVV